MGVSFRRVVLRPHFYSPFKVVPIDSLGTFGHYVKTKEENYHQNARNNIIVSDVVPFD